MSACMRAGDGCMSAPENIYQPSKARFTQFGRQQLIEVVVRIKLRVVSRALSPVEYVSDSLLLVVQGPRVIDSCRVALSESRREEWSLGLTKEHLLILRGGRDNISLGQKKRRGRNCLPKRHVSH